MDKRLIFSSHQLEFLVDELSAHLSDDVFSKPLLVVPCTAMAEWLQVELCKRAKAKGLLGLEFALWPQALPPLPVPRKTDILAAAYAVSGEKLALHQLSLLTEFHFHGPDSGPEKAFFETHDWTPLFRAIETVSPQASRPLFLFCVDSIPAAVYRFFLRHPTVKVFRFSPCAMFWEDVRSSREQQWLLRRSKHNTSLETLLKDTHPLLANWAVAGREQLKLDGDIQTAENYAFEEPVTRLDHVKHDFLLLEQSTEPCSPEDDSIQVIKTGASRLREVETLCREILKFREQGIPFDEMRVYAPDIEPYTSLLEFVCKNQVPIRIASREQSKQSPFYQALLLLFEGVNGYWNKHEVLTLFENKAFVGSRLDLKKLHLWIEQGHIRWGLDAQHRAELSAVPSAAGSWHEGFNRLMDKFIRLQPDDTDTMAWSDAETFEQFAEVFETLQTALRSWKKVRSFPEWAEAIEAVVKQFLLFDEKTETVFFHFLDTLRNTHDKTPVPLSLVQALFDPSRIEETSALHAVRCASLEKGNIFPARVMFLIGMDEESFPRSTLATKQSTEKLPQNVWDRYLFLQALFAAKETLVISYGDRSPEDGKVREPSLLVNELLGYLQTMQIVDIQVDTTKEPKPKTPGLWQPLTLPVPSPSIQDLNRFVRHPIRYYLENVLHLSLPEEPSSLWEEFEHSPLQTHQSLQSFLEEKQPPEAPLGLFGKHTELLLEEKKLQFQEALETWGLRKQDIRSVELPNGMGHLVVPNGVLHMGDDTIRGMLRRWPEILAVLAHTNTHSIFCLRTSRVREVQNPQESLQKIEALFAQFHSTPLLFHPDWADAMLRKNQDPDDATEDLTLQWMLDRCPGLDHKHEWQKARTVLRETLASLIALFPTRSSHANV